jgi:D-beta-D-heptose 7-phosphate kinase/D-beta-D-heptose 1-phosphate adenosyltransferase
MTQARLEELLGAFAGKRVLVVGDCMLDEYLWGSVGRISPEAPVMVVDALRTSYAAGGASNVAANIVAMEGRVSIAAVVGDDAQGQRLRDELERQGVGHHGLVVDPARPTTVKTRIVAHSQQVLRVDREDRSPLPPALANRLVDSVREELAEADAVVLSDYSKGVLTPDVIAAVLQAASDAGKPAFANPKPSSLAQYRGLSYVQLNQSEAENATGLGLADLARAEAAGARLLELCRAEAALITLGGRGLAVFEAGQSWAHLPVISAEVYDACGCGDTCIAAATMARAAGAGWVEAAVLANLAGNAKVRKLGVVPVTRPEIAAMWHLAVTG